MISGRFNAVRRAALPVWTVPVVALGVAAIEWLKESGVVLAATVAVMAAASVVLLRPIDGWRKRTLLVVLTVLAVVVARSEWTLQRIEAHWPEEREARVVEAGERLSAGLREARVGAQTLAEFAARVSAGDSITAFRALAQATRSRALEVSAVIFDSTGHPWAWGGRVRLLPQPRGPAIALQQSPYYALLQVRRAAGSRMAVASVLLWAAPAVVDREWSLAAQLEAVTQAAIEIYAPKAAPANDATVYDWEERTTAGPHQILSARPVPPSQAQARERAEARGHEAVKWLVLSALALALALAARAADRALLLGLALWVAARAPSRLPTDLAGPFSKATYFLALPGGGTAGILAVGVVGVMAALAALWRWRSPRPAALWRRIGATALVAGLPWVAHWLSEGITPPPGGTDVALWLVWQLAIFAGTAALLALAAAWWRDGAAQHSEAVPLGALAAVSWASAGVLLWTPSGWPAWYLPVWVPILAVVARPARPAVAMLGIGIAAGAFAAVLTWRAELDGRLAAAELDVARLGDEPDAGRRVQLEEFSDTVGSHPAPASATELYALWRGSALQRQRYPAHLAVWGADGSRGESLVLDSLDVGPLRLDTLVRTLDPAVPARLLDRATAQGVLGVLVRRLPEQRVLTVVIGPRSRLIQPSRLGRLLEPRVRRPAPYLVETNRARAPDDMFWRRDGWVIRGTRALPLLGHDRAAEATINLRGGIPIAVRGALFVVMDLVLLLALAAAAALAGGDRPARLGLRRMATAFRARLALTLAAFCVLPVAAFAAWFFLRLGEEAALDRDRVLAENLRDAVRQLPGGPGARWALADASRSVGAEFALYVDGRHTASSSPLLHDLGIVQELLPPEVYVALALRGETQRVQEGQVPRLADRVGYLAREGQGQVLASVEPSDEGPLEQGQEDLALLVLLVAIGGSAAAVVGAGAAAGSLARPVADLRDAALALGAGRPMPVRPRETLVEFEPVFGAFARMADDVRASQAALEDARRRTAAVLARVATGVVAIDTEGRVQLANARAEEILGLPLPVGADFGALLGPAWQPLAHALEGPSRRGRREEPPLELNVGGRRVAAEYARLGPEQGGVVLALNDVTELSRAERVLAWGEMARQVAHEIKNPLTPMRLGVQHLQRAWRAGRGEFDQTLDETTARILTEIDHLDTIARTFSRFGAPGEAAQEVGQIDLREAAAEVIRLYQLAGEGAQVRLEAGEVAWGAARRDELKEVLVNLLENARNAGARTIVVTARQGELAVADDGQGIHPDHLPRIFEPRFSTQTSGSGLGLAIVRRLVEGWGGTIRVSSELGVGTRVELRLASDADARLASG